MNQLCLPVTFGADPKAPVLNEAKLQELKSKRVSDYFNDKLTEERTAGTFDADLKVFISNAQSLAVFPPGNDFQEWWQKNRSRFTDPEKLRQVKDVRMSAFVTKMFLLHTAEQAIAIDDADPEAAKKRAEGKATAGDEHFAETVTRANDSAGALLLLGLGALGGFAIGFGHRLIDVFFHGPIAALMNSTVEPIIRPVRERLEQLVNTHLAPRFVTWANFVTGEAGKRKRAKQAAAAGKELTGSAARYDHPAIGVEDFTADTEIFYKEMLRADYSWRGWIANELARARSTGFELLYHQYRLLGEQLTGYQNTGRVNENLEASKYLPSLRAAGVSDDDLYRFQKLSKDIHELTLYSGFKDPRLAPAQDEMKALLEKFKAAKVPMDLVEDYHMLLQEMLIAKDRPAFLLASVLDGERYFQENNLALKNLPQLQSWQEHAREMTGFYDELTKHREKIQMFFTRRGLRYDVQKRIDQRGYPLGGQRRPETEEPHVNCVVKYMRLLDNARADSIAATRKLK